MAEVGVYPDSGLPCPDPVVVTAAVVTPPTLTVVPGNVQTINGEPYYIQVAPRIWDGFNARYSKVFGGVLIACALFSAILNVAGLCVYDGWGFSAFMIGHGFVGLVFYILAGSFAISAAKKKTTCKIVSTLVLCIIAVIFGGIIQIVASSVGVGLTASTYARLVNTKNSRFVNPWNWCGVGTDYDDYGDYGGYDYYYRPDTDGASPRLYPTFIALHTMMLIAGLVQFISAIWCSVIACRTVCCCKKPVRPAAAHPRMTPAEPLGATLPIQAPLYMEHPPSYTNYQGDVEKKD